MRQRPKQANYLEKFREEKDEEDERELLPIRDSLDNLDISNTPKEK
jgi:hypothetical protein